jgi:hypothetical protein
MDPQMQAVLAGGAIALVSSLLTLALQALISDVQDRNRRKRDAEERKAQEIRTALNSKDIWTYAKVA